MTLLTQSPRWCCFLTLLCLGPWSWANNRNVVGKTIVSENGTSSTAQSSENAQAKKKRKRARSPHPSKAALQRMLKASLLEQGHLKDDGVKQRGKGGAIQRSDDGSVEQGSEYLRPPRARNEDQIRQVLTQMSSQLFQAATDEQRAGPPGVKRPVEIEMMTDDKGNVFIAANNNSTLDIVETLFVNNEGFKSVLKGVYGGSGTYRLQLSTKHSKKFKAFSDGTRDERKKDAVPIYKALAEAESLVRIDSTGDLGENDFDKDGGNVFLVYGELGKNGKETGRHAEEELMDVAEKLGGEWSETYTVAGKKRPCMSCYGRMLHVNDKNAERSEDDKFTVIHGTHYGRLFIKPWLNQPPELAEYTFDKVIKQGVSYITVARGDEDDARVKTDQDSESDSEEEMADDKDAEI